MNVLPDESTIDPSRAADLLCRIHKSRAAEVLCRSLRRSAAGSFESAARALEEKLSPTRTQFQSASFERSLVVANVIARLLIIAAIQLIFFCTAILWNRALELLSA